MLMSLIGINLLMHVDIQLSTKTF